MLTENENETAEKEIVKMLEDHKCTVAESTRILMDVRNMIEKSPVHLEKD